MTQSSDDDAHSRIETMLGKCPFPKDDARYQSWLEVGFMMLEAHSNFQAEFLERAVGASTDQLADLAIESIVRQFDIPAGAVVATTTDYQSAVEREQLLKSVADSYLKWFSSVVARGPTWMRQSVSISTARLRLQQRVAHWTAQSLRFAREVAKRQQLPRAAAEPVAPPDVVSVTFQPPLKEKGPAGKSSGRRFPDRAAWLEAQLNSRRWTATDLERCDGPNARTVRRILAGHSVRQTVLEKLVHALSLRKAVTLSDIPNS